MKFLNNIHQIGTVFFAFSLDDFGMCFSNNHVNNFRMFGNNFGQGIQHGFNTFVFANQAKIGHHNFIGKVILVFQKFFLFPKYGMRSVRNYVYLRFLRTVLIHQNFLGFIGEYHNFIG